MIGEERKQEADLVEIEEAEAEEAVDRQSVTSVVKTGILDTIALHVATNANYANIRVV